MNTTIPPYRKKGNASRAWICRLLLGVVLIGVSAWGVALCGHTFSVFVGPGTLPQDSSFANLAAWVAWALFFGPLAAAGVMMLWSTLRKMGALDQFAFWLWGRSGQQGSLLASANPFAEISPACDQSDPRSLESLTPETVERLQRAGARAAAILGGLVGASCLGLGMFGLVSLLFFSRPYSGSSIYASLAAGRLEIYFAVFSGMLVFLGFAILQRTFRRESGGWLLPFRVFTYLIARRRAGERARLVERHLPDTKQHPRV